MTEADDTRAPVAAPSQLSKAALWLGLVGLIAAGSATLAGWLEVRELRAEVRTLRDEVNQRDGLLRNASANSYGTVPDVVGVPFRVAKAILHSGGFGVSPDPANLDAPVLHQYPAPGIRVPRGTGVALTTDAAASRAAACAASGPATVVVPDVIGRRLPDAAAAVALAGLSVVGAGVHDDDPVSSDAVVVSQEPGAGSMVAAGACVGFRTRN